MASRAFVVVSAENDIRSVVEAACARADYEILSVGADGFAPSLAALEPSCVVLDLERRAAQALPAVEALAGARYIGPVLLIGGDPARQSDIVTAARALGLQVAAPLAWPIGNAEAECALRGLCSAPAALGPDDLAYALQAGHILPYYQPKLDLRRGSFVSVEALVRWKHPLRGLVSPAEFVPMAEAAGLIDPITWLVLQRSCRQAKAWEAQDLTLSVAVNVSPRTLSDPAFVDEVSRIASAEGLEPGRLVLEVTETAMLEGADAMETLRRVRARGFGLSLDDFGTGFSSLSRLYQSPFTELKIDQSFLFDLDARHEARVMVESSVSLAHRLGLSACAEGVENESGWNALAAMGCDFAQGFLMSRPRPADEIPAFAQEWRSSSLSHGGGSVRVAEASAGLPDDFEAVWQELHKSMDCPMASSWTIGRADATVIMSDRTMLATDFAEPGVPSSVRSAIEERKILQRIREPLAAGRPYEALAGCESLTDLLRGIEAEEPLAVSERLRAVIERDLLFSSDSLVEFADQQIVLLRRDVVSLGRPAAGIPVDIPVRCKYLSRADRQLRIGIEDTRYWIEDLGSTNGITLHGARIPSGRRIGFDAREGEIVLGLGGGQGRIQSPCLVRLRRVGKALVLKIEAGQIGRQDDTANLTSAWPTREQDCARSWVLLRGTVGIGNAPDCAIPLPGGPGGRVAELSCEGGYRLRSVHPGAATMNGSTLRGEVPVSPDTEIALCGVRFLFRAAGLPEARADRLSA